MSNYHIWIRSTSFIPLIHVFAFLILIRNIVKVIDYLLGSINI